MRRHTTSSRRPNRSTPCVRKCSIRAVRAVSIRGRILSPLGSPLGDCSVSIGRQVVVPSDKDGGFEIGGLRPGLHAVTVYTKGKSFLRDVRAPATDVVITIE